MLLAGVRLLMPAFSPILGSILGSAQHNHLSEVPSMHAFWLQSQLHLLGRKPSFVCRMDGVAEIQ